MENAPIEKGISFIKWWSRQTDNGKLWALMMSYAIFITTVTIYLWTDVTALQSDNLNYAKDCEARAAVVAIRERNRSDSMLAFIRNKSDSTVAADRIKHEIELQKLFITRTQEIKNNNEKIKTVLR